MSNMDAAIEAGARALYEGMEIGRWEDANRWVKDTIRVEARRCIEAAAPYLRA